MKIIAIVQARLSSTRLPGKVLRRVRGRPMIEYLLDPLARARALDGFAIATSLDPSDDPIASYAAARGLDFHRGPLDDVAARFKGLLDSRTCDAFVRITADAPLLDHRVVDRLVGVYREGGAEVVTNVHPRTFPKGQSVEVVSVEAFRRALERMTDPADREHVTRYIYANASAFGIRNVTMDPPANDLDLSIDTPEQAERLERILAALGRPHYEVTVTALVEIVRGLDNHEDTKTLRKTET